MKLNATTQYAIQVVMYLTLKDEIVNSKTLSEKVFVSQNYLQKLIRKLIKGDVIQQFRGVNGGYSLAKSPKEITLLEVINIMEKNNRYVAGCVEDPELCVRYKETNSDEIVRQCDIHKVFLVLQDNHDVLLGAINFYDLTFEHDKVHHILERIAISKEEEEES